MVIYSREKVARLREQYPAGTRICLNSMDGEAGMPQGLEGTVQYVDDAGQLGIKLGQRQKSLTDTGSGFLS